MRRLVRFLFAADRRTLTLIVVLLVLAAAVATATGFWLLFRLAYVLGLALPVCWFIAWYNTRSLDVEVDRRTTRAQVGQEADEVIDIHNRGFLPKLWLEVEDPSTMPEHLSRRIVIIPPRSHRNWLVRTPLTRRGLFDWGPVRVTSTDPFGIFRRERTFGPVQQLLVYPPAVDLPRFQAPPANLPGEGRFRRRTHYVTPNAAGIREYAPGDAFNRIHWKSYARTGTLMVKTFELDPASDVWVMVDMDERVHAGHGEESTEEYSVQAAASIARHYLLLNRAVGFISFSRQLQVEEPERGQQQLTRILEHLAMASAEGDGPLANLLTEEARRFGRHTTLIVVTPSSENRWLTAVQALAQRGVRLAVVLVDAGSFGGKTSPLMLYGELTASNILTYVVRKGDDLGLTLSAPGGVAAWQE
ncbi:MAG: DUF58 domain-containing protein [Dehalococcoidia bacterium]|nr:DUF58 domain-containing protein [Dehalococcoidia bacterium]